MIQLLQELFDYSTATGSTMEDGADPRVRNFDVAVPTPAQAEAGNYRKGHTRVHGMEITVENPAGSVRHGRVLPHHYGYIRRTTGADGDHVDVFLGPDLRSETVYVIAQHSRGEFDEHKCMLGFPDEATAVEAYKSTNPNGFGGVKAMPIAEFKGWVLNAFCPTGPGGGVVATCSPGLLHRLGASLGRKYAAMEKRYGKKAAVAIIASAIVLLPSPVPFSSYLPIAVAEAVRWAGRFVRNSTDPRVRRVVEEICAEAGWPTPTMNFNPFHGAHGRFASAVGAAKSYMRDVTRQLYSRLERRYGRKQAIAIMASAQVVGWGALGVGAAIGVPLYLPGVSVWGTIPAVVLAEVYHQVRARLVHNSEADPRAVRLVRTLERVYINYLRANPPLTATANANPNHDERGRFASAGHYDKRTGEVRQPSVLRYKAMDPVPILDSGEIRPSGTFGGVSLTSAKGLEAHGPFELEFDNPGTLDLKPALYPEFEYGEDDFPRPILRVKDQFGNEYTSEEWEAIPFGKPTAEHPTFRQNEMFAGEAEWRSLGPVPIVGARVTVHKDQPGWRMRPRKNARTLKELIARGLVANFNPHHDRRGRFSAGAEVGVPPVPRYRVDVEADHNRDGVTDVARVGVPAMTVPPPPPIPRLPNLSRREKAVEEDFASAYEANPDVVAGQYRRLAMKHCCPPTFSTDDAKVLHDTWSDPDPRRRMVNRATLNLALHATANAIAKRAFLQHLDTLAPGDGVLVTVGGCGAGKGYALKCVPEALELKEAAKAVWDSAGDQNATESPWVQAQADRRGLRVSYVYVHADPKEQWAHPERGVVKRAQDPKDGRMVDARVFADSYAIGARNHAAFAEQNAGRATFITLENTGTPRLLPGVPEEALTIDRHRLAEFAAGAVKGAPTHVKFGALAGQRVWNAGDPLAEWWREDAERLNALASEARATLNFNPNHGAHGRFASSNDPAARMRAIAKEMVAKSGYSGKITVHSGKGPRFQSGGETWETDARCFPDRREIEAWAGSSGGLEEFRGTMAHEMMHQIAADALEADPRFATFFKPMVGARDWRLEDDGVSEYSASYWKEYRDRPGVRAYETAVHETLAEIAKGEEQTGVVLGSKNWQDLYTMVREASRKGRPAPVGNARGASRAVVVGDRLHGWIGGARVWARRVRPAANVGDPFRVLLNPKLWADVMARARLQGRRRFFDDAHDPADPDVAGRRAEVVGNRARTAAPEGLEGVVRALAERAVLRGFSKESVAGRLMREVGIAQVAAERLARTAITRAHADGQIEAATAMGKRLRLVNGGKPCAQCALLRGAEHSPEEAAGVIPIHPNCCCMWTPVGRRRHGS